MKLGILVTTDRHREHVLGLARAALARGHQVAVFSMDEGIRLLRDPEYRRLCGLPGVQMAFCDLSTKQYGVSKEGVPGEIVCGSQYDNARMMHDADRVVAL
ncbi:MAG: DsrE family protein [Nitrospirota bacterium]|jgi:predicted peroxiredoxin